MGKVIFFTAGETATVGEAADIAQLIAAMAANITDVAVRRGDLAAEDYSYGAGLEAADFVAGTIPAAYDDEEDFPVINPDALAPSGVPSTSKVIASGVKFTGPAITGSYVDGYTPTIVAGVVTALVAS
jgi:hypothetical protein